MNKGIATIAVLLVCDYGATMFPVMEEITKNEKRLLKPKNELRLRGEYQATMKNNFQFDYGATMTRATMKQGMDMVESGRNRVEVGEKI